MDDVSVLNLFIEAGLVVKIVMIALFLASILSWIIIVERYRFFKKIKSSNDNFLKKFWSGQDIDELLSLIPENQRTYGAMSLLQNSYAEFKSLNITRDLKEITTFEEWSYNKINESERIAGIIKERIIQRINETK